MEESKLALKITSHQTEEAIELLCGDGGDLESLQAIEMSLEEKSVVVDKTFKIVKDGGNAKKGFKIVHLLTKTKNMSRVEFLPFLTPLEILTLSILNKNLYQVINEAPQVPKSSKTGPPSVNWQKGWSTTDKKANGSGGPHHLHQILLMHVGRYDPKILESI